MTVELLHDGSEKVCIQPDVQAALKKIIVPAASTVPGDATAQAKITAVHAIKLTFDATTLRLHLRGINQVQCRMTAHLAGASGTAQQFQVDYEISPSAEDASSVIVNAKADDAIAFAQTVIMEALDVAEAKRVAAADRSTRGQRLASSGSVIDEQWLMGAWADASDAGGCDDKAEWYNPNHTYNNYELTGRWELSGDELHIVADDEDRSEFKDTIVQANENSFTVVTKEGERATYRRCTNINISIPGDVGAAS